MTFHVGQKVVCVKAVGPLVDGRVYIIRRLSSGYEGDSAGLEGVHVDGIINRSRPYGRGECGFHPRRFRPITEKSTKTGMAILREILDRESILDRKPVKVKQ